jgi:hypothetical protein
MGPGLVAATVLAYVAGVALAAILHRRPQRAQVRTESRRYSRRRDAASDLWAALRIDHAGVWRSAPLRRGLLALGAIPGAAAAATGLEWPMLALLPGLAASGAALLFGVNALCLDGPGALWRETLPGSPRILLLARLAVVTEVCLAAALLALVAAASRAPGLPTPAELAAVGCALLVTTAHVVVACAQWSLDRPYAASLRDPRDQPAPPGAMAGYSARLAVSTTLTGIMFVLLARAEGGVVESAGPALLITTALLYFAWRRLKAVLHRWDVPEIRSDVMATVAGARASA